MAESLLRIGALSERTGVSPELLRAWERRYGLLQPVRTEGGFRLYTGADVRRIAAMQELLRRGVPAREAAQAVLQEPESEGHEATPADGHPLDESREALHASFGAFDEAGAQRLLDDAFGRYEAEYVCTELLIPELHRIGEEWAAGRLSVGQEHFASNLIRARLVAIARGWERGVGPHALLACPPDEHHDVSLVMFGLALSRWGWRITFLGAHTPVATLRDAARLLSPRLVALYSPDEARFAAVAKELRAFGREFDLRLAGAGATAAVLQSTRAGVLEGDPVSAAARLVREDSAP